MPSFAILLLLLLLLQLLLLSLFGNFELDDVLGPWEYHRCHEVEEMIANDGIESSVGGM